MGLYVPTVRLGVDLYCISFPTINPVSPRWYFYLFGVIWIMICHLFLISTDILQYYLRCNAGQTNPFQQVRLWSSSLTPSQYIFKYFVQCLVGLSWYIQFSFLPIDDGRFMMLVFYEDVLASAQIGALYFFIHLSSAWSLIFSIPDNILSKQI